MAELKLEVAPALLRMLQQSARLNGLSLEDECLRRLEGHVRRSRRLEEVMEEMRHLRGQTGAPQGQ
ncbi:hypothetical protein SAMN05216214_107129 [Atopomonas hussainii]|uniref:Uncharacterized protein n=1 Tax=Atopomonas hussainii TaxID=1429083 RepID=A0A1H7LUI1_9GAMM|nr:hypothetical protein [Atopomonas hussainii]SEL02590.1 hypothetical protein SAMN05216214_107129 [Atopomonas hussainii]